MKKVMIDIIGRMLFVPERLLIDNCLIAHEFMQFVKKRKKGRDFASILKINLNKAYDTIKWEFIRRVLKDFNFPNNWVERIIECITKGSYSILVNGEVSDLYKPGFGLRQGVVTLRPPILSFCAWRFFRGKWFRGLEIGRRSPRINHLFADNELLFSMQPRTPVVSS